MKRISTKTGRVALTLFMLAALAIAEEDPPGQLEGQPERILISRGSAEFDETAPRCDVKLRIAKRCTMTCYLLLEEERTVLVIPGTFINRIIMGCAKNEQPELWKRIYYDKGGKRYILFFDTSRSFEYIEGLDKEEERLLARIPRDGRAIP